MAKKKEQTIQTRQVEIPKEKPNYFPKLMMVFSLILIILAVVNFFNFYPIPGWVNYIFLLWAGLWLLKISFAKGFGEKRKEILKKYI